jgi:hypothetical protein
MSLLRLVTVCLAVSCAPAPRGPRPIPWEQVTNPVLRLEENAIKDAFAARDAEGRWHLGFSHITETPFRFRLGFAETGDWRDFDVLPTIDQEDVGGLASPNVTRMPDGRWVMTYNSHTRDVGTTLNKLYFRVSDDLRTWSEPQRFHIEGADADDDRLIDVTIAFAGETGAFLFFKREQEATVAHSVSGALEGPWRVLGRMEPSYFENLQVLQLDGVWHLVGTKLPVVHTPTLLQLEGDPADPHSWLRWTEVRPFSIREQSWNTGPNELSYERANAGYLIDDRAVDGHFYLLYAGSTEVTSFSGRGHAALGLARSTDLKRWEVAAEP